MTDTEIFSQMIKDSARVQIEYLYERPFVRLVEPQDQDSIAEIRHLPSDALIIKIDCFSAPDDIFNGRFGECKRADYVIVSAEKKCFIFIEMKRKKDDWKQIVRQLQGAQCFIKYCQEIGRTFWGEKEFLTDYQFRFVSIGHTSIAKRKTRITRAEGKHDRPDKAMKVDWPSNLQFNMLAGLKL